jgi:3',5'-cyclic AMP phosphodiesterase CpdA
VVTAVTLVHLSDLHFGRDVDLRQVDAIAELVPSLSPDAIVVSGDLTQRARHGEFQAALAWLARLRRTAPVLVTPGNHDVQYWQSPLHLRGPRPLYAKWRRYFGEELAPSLELPGALLCAMLSSHGMALRSFTWKPNILTAVPGHLTAAEFARVRARFDAAPAGAARVVVLHHNVLRGEISRRMGLAWWKQAAARMVALAPDVILYGHDHQEAATQLEGRIAVSAAGTHTSRTRGKRPSAFNEVTITADAVTIAHHRWDAARGAFARGDAVRLPRPPRT